MALNVTTLKSVFSILKIAPAVYEKVQAWRGKPSEDDCKRLIKYARRLNERRVFSVHFNVEVVEACVSSLSYTAKYTDEALSELDHAAARAIVAGILDCIRRFLDKWGSYHTPRLWEQPWPGRDEQEFPEFFKDLGELRGKIKMLVGMMTELEPEAVAPNLTDEKDEPAS